jgi:hypothetical protein
MDNGNKPATRRLNTVLRHLTGGEAPPQQTTLSTMQTSAKKDPLQDKSAHGFLSA